MAYNSNVDVIFRGVQGGQMCVNALEYHREAYAPGATAPALAAAFSTDVWTPLRAIVCGEFQMLQIEVTLRQFNGTFVEQDTSILELNQDGLVAGDVLPPNVTVRIVKQVDNSTIFPVGAPLFRNGFVGFSGAQESHQNNGLLTGPGYTAWQAIANAIEQVAIIVGVDTFTWDLGLERGELNPAKVLTPICITSQRLGTRNSRKR